MKEPRVFFEVVPPSRLASEEQRAKALHSIAAAARPVDALEALNVPEVVEENHQGKPFYRNEEVCGFSERLRAESGKNVIPNKVVVHLDGRAGFLEWLDTAVNAGGFKDFVFVGGNTSAYAYAGPTVTEAIRLARERFDLRLGCILIPSRENEAERMLHKTLAGASFFTTQILFSADPLKAVLESYHAKCVDAGVKPSEVFLSLAPVSKPHDLEFMKWLGAEISPASEQRLFAAGASPVAQSIELAKAIWLETTQFTQNEGLKLRLGLNVEEIFLHNLLPSLEMVKALSGAKARLRTPRNQL